MRWVAVALLAFVILQLAATFGASRPFFSMSWCCTLFSTSLSHLYMGADSLWVTCPPGLVFVVVKVTKDTQVDSTGTLRTVDTDKVVATASVVETCETSLPHFETSPTLLLFCIRYIIGVFTAASADTVKPPRCLDQPLRRCAATRPPTPSPHPPTSPPSTSC